MLSSRVITLERRIGRPPPRSLRPATSTPSNLTGTLTAIVNGHKQRQIEGLLPWNYAVALRLPKGISWPKLD